MYLRNIINKVFTEYIKYNGVYRNIYSMQNYITGSFRKPHVY